MAWIELHQSLWTHHKTIELAAQLGIDPTHAGGLMARLWTWCLDNAPDGDLSRLSATAIAVGAGWTGKPEDFVEAAIKAGFLDRDPDGRQGLFVHDWHDYAGRLMERRQQWAEKVQRKRQLYDNMKLTRAVRARDGDRCRYCGRVVNWRDRKGPAGGTYDLVDPAGPNTPENAVVSCRACASRKGNRTLEDAGMRLLPPPGDGPADNLPEICRESAGDLPEIYRESAADLPEICRKSAIPNLTVPNPTDQDLIDPIQEEPDGSSCAGNRRREGKPLTGIQALMADTVDAIRDALGLSRDEVDNDVYARVNSLRSRLLKIDGADRAVVENALRIAAGKAITRLEEGELSEDLETGEPLDPVGRFKAALNYMDTVARNLVLQGVGRSRDSPRYKVPSIDRRRWKTPGD